LSSESLHGVGAQRLERRSLATDDAQQKNTSVQTTKEAVPKLARKVLVVDDNLDNVRSLALLFHAMGHHVDYAINATAAVGMAVQMRPDIIFLDILLPDGHGANVCTEMRAHSALKNARIIGVTASSRMIDHQLALDAGCDDVLRKPVATRVYERIIAGGATRRQLRDFISKQPGDKN
jgi:CheY-like chemotaxis protein